MDAFPVELMQEILQHLKPDFGSPTIGGDAVWKLPKKISSWWPHKRHDRGGDDAPEVIKVSNKPLYTDYKEILPLRLVSRLFNETCTPFLYQELNIFDRRENIDHEIATRYGQYVKVLRISVRINAFVFHDVGLVKILSLCNNIESIGLYYEKEGSLIGPDAQAPLVAELLSAIRERGLKSIGFYSPKSYKRSGGGAYNSDQHLFYDMATSDQAKLIKTLDVYFGDIQRDIWIGPLWSNRLEDSYWGPYSNLTKLQLINCYNVYSFKIATLVRHFHSLEYFLISACQSPWRGRGPAEGHGREKGWSSRSDGWWNTKKPLKLMHIEHMTTSDMLAMGTIPALEITAVSLCAGDLARTFIDDHEAFPHLKLLRAECLESKRFGGHESLEEERISEEDLKVVCNSRGIEFRRDASCYMYYR
ncbi:hypothetical protein CPB86DRAFT_779003 [Serendipita vermifera]|nr:hypothetical protein CPB86DRAFT_779003 [Serendipita vermifera]